VLRSPLRIAFQAFEGFRQFWHNTKGSPRSLVGCFLRNSLNEKILFA
jgi:hypothetical protein